LNKNRAKNIININNSTTDRVLSKNFKKHDSKILPEELKKDGK